jgi:hypothetical protein
MGFIPATANVVRHLFGAPLVLLGLLVAAYPGGVARLYRNIYRDLGFRSFAWWYEGRRGLWLMRAAGMIFAAGGAYWVVVGTG